MVLTVNKPWLAHYPKEIPAHIDYEEKPLFSYLKEAYKQDPTKQALYFLGKTMTYEQLYHQVLALANQLIHLGLQKGERVAIMLPNCPQGMISYYSVMVAGGIAVPVNPMYTERELAFQLTDSGAKMIIALDMFYPKITKIKEQTKIETIIITSIKEYLPFPKNILYPILQKRKQTIVVDITYNDHVVSFKKLIESGEKKDPQIVIHPKEDIAILQYTGGTTGQSKGVMLTHYNLVVNTTQCKYWMHRAEVGEEKILAVLPFFHVYGMTVSMNFALMHRAEMVILPRFNAKEVLKTIEARRPTLFPGAPTMYISLLNTKGMKQYDLSSINACMSGSAALPIEVQEQFERVTDGKLVEGYGLTEASPITHANLIWGTRIKGSIGIPWPDTDAKIIKLGSEHEEASLNEIGELVVKGPQVMKGYWGRPEETEAALKEGWLYTGDLGYMDENGYFYIVDRKKDLIIAGGFNIYPREIEEVLYEHPALKEVVVCGIPDAYRGETVKAYIVKKEGQHVTEEELNHYCRERLAAFKVPHVYEFRNELPKTMVGKILRRVLLEEEKEKQKR